MKIGLVYPQTEFSSDPAAIKDYAQMAEDLGYTHILAYDHILGINPPDPDNWPGPYTHEDPFQEIFSLYSFMAGFTEQIEFVTGVLILPQRETTLAAKQAAQLDVLSGGRVRLGVGIGWNKVEMESIGYDFSNRGRRIEEQVEVMRLLWTQPVVTYEGEWHSLSDVGINPMPVQQPIPVWFGGHHDNVLRRIGMMGDGWMPGFQDAEQAKPSLEKIAGYAEEAGRTMDEIGMEPRMYYGNGNVDEWQVTMDGWQGIGATHLSLNTMNGGFTNDQQHLDAVRDFAEKVGIG